MAATANITAVLQAQASAPGGTVNVTRLALDATAELAATTNTIAQITVYPDDAITAEPQTIEIKLWAAALAVTPDNTTEKIGLTAHGYSDGQPVEFAATAMPTGLTAGLRYYVRDKTTDDFKLALTPGGSVVTFSSNGTSVTVRPLGGVSLSYSYPSSGPVVPVLIKDRVTGETNDFRKIRAVQIILRPLDTAADASGRAQLTCGNASDKYDHFSVPLALDFTAAGAENWPSALLSMPEGLDYNTSWHLTLRVEDDVSNENLLIHINLLGN